METALFPFLPTIRFSGSSLNISPAFPPLSRAKACPGRMLSGNGAVRRKAPGFCPLAGALGRFAPDAGISGRTPVFCRALWHEQPPFGRFWNFAASQQKARYRQGILLLAAPAGGAAAPAWPLSGAQMIRGRHPPGRNRNAEHRQRNHRTTRPSRRIRTTAGNRLSTAATAFRAP